jgi:UDP:flavonoid glycosyltransferase YjiC (YdhE family)
VTPAQLAARLRDVLGSPALLRRAEEVGQKLRQEDGVAAAVRIIEDACPIMLPRVA